MPANGLKTSVDGVESRRRRPLVPGDAVVGGPTGAGVGAEMGAEVGGGPGSPVEKVRTVPAQCGAGSRTQNGTSAAIAAVEQVLSAKRSPTMFIEKSALTARGSSSSAVCATPPPRRVGDTDSGAAVGRSREGRFERFVDAPPLTVAAHCCPVDAPPLSVTATAPVVMSGGAWPDPVRPGSCAWRSSSGERSAMRAAPLASVSIVAGETNVAPLDAPRRGHAFSPASTSQPSATLFTSLSMYICDLFLTFAALSQSLGQTLASPEEVEPKSQEAVT